MTGRKEAQTPWAISLLVMVALSGCATWKEESTPPSELPQAPISDTTVVFEMARISLSTEDEHSLKDMWTEIDEQILPLEKRRELAKNGVRVGLLNFHVPPELRAILKKSTGKKDAIGTELVRVDGDASVAINRRRFPAGKRSEYVMVPAQPQLTVLQPSEGTIVGKTFDDAECKLILISSPDNDGRVSLSVVPEIHHGQAKQRYSGGDGMLRIETRKERMVLEQLAFTAKLKPAQVLVLTSSPEAKGLGRVFFEREHAGIRRRQILLLRLAGSQFDDLFRETNPDEENGSLNAESTEGLLPSTFDDPQSGLSGD